MHNIKFLEEKWMKYKRKKRRPWYVLVIVCLLLLALLFFFVPKESTNVKTFFKSLPERIGKHFNFFDTSPSYMNGPLIRLEVRKSILHDNTKKKVDTDMVDDYYN